MKTFSALLALLCGKLTGHRWIPHTKASDVGLWCFFDSHGWPNYNHVQYIPWILYHILWIGLFCLNMVLINSTACLWFYLLMLVQVAGLSEPVIHLEFIPNVDGDVISPFYLRFLINFFVDVQCQLNMKVFVYMVPVHFIFRVDDTHNCTDQQSCTFKIVNVCPRLCSCQVLALTCIERIHQTIKEVSLMFTIDVTLMIRPRMLLYW